jgi:hypothetical protein
MPGGMGGGMAYGYDVGSFAQRRIDKSNLIST